MGTLYLVDRHNPTVANSAIKDTFIMNGGTHEIRGTFPVNLPFEVPMDGTPTTVSDLITKKYAGILSLYPGYSHIVYDEQLDGSGWDLTKANGDQTCYSIGSRKTTKIVSNNGAPIYSNIVTLASTPVNCILRYEVFRYQDTDGIGSQYQRLYSEVPPGVVGSGVSAAVSFDNDAHVIPIVNGVATAIPADSRGPAFRVQFSNYYLTYPVYIGSWALIY